MSKNKSKKPIFWVCGNYYESKQMVKKIISHIEDANVVSLDCGYNPSDLPVHLRYATAADIISILKNSDIFDDKPRIIKLRGLPEDYTILFDYLNLINDNNVLLIEAPIGYQKDSRFISAAASKFYKTILAEGRLLDFGTEAKTDAEAEKWVKRVCNELEKDIDAEALKMLVRLKGKDYDSLYAELILLVDLIGPKEQITTELVRLNCVPVLTSTVWELLDNLDSQDLDKSLSIIDLYQNENNFKASAEEILAALKRHYLFLILVKDGCGETASYEKCINSVKGFKKITKEEFDKDMFEGYVVSMALKNAHFMKSLNWSKSKIYMVYLNVLRCHSKIRQIYSEEFSKTVITSLILFICGKIDEKQLLGNIGYSGKEIQSKLGFAK